MKIRNLQTLPWYFRVAMFAAVAAFMYVGFWYLVTRSTRAETKELNDKIAELLPKNAQAQIASQRLSEFKVAYQNRQEEYDELKALLPEERELTMVLQGVQDRARNARLSLRKFLPKEDVQQELYSGKKIDVGVTSSFPSLRLFFDQMARYQRIVSITNFEIKQSDKQGPGKTVEARFDLTAYYVSAERLQKNAGAQGPTSPPPGGAVANPRN